MVDSLKNYISIYRWPVSPQCLSKVKQVAKELNTHEDFLMAIMFVESSFNPQADNGRAVGLIQFEPEVAQELGTSTAALKRMNFIEQMDWVKKYFQMWMGRKNLTSLPTMEHVSIIVFAPSYIGQPLDTVLYQAPSQFYEDNKELDLNNDGKITIRERMSVVQKAVKPFRIKIAQEVSDFIEKAPKLLGSK